jgi:hypothetical protein
MEETEVYSEVQRTHLLVRKKDISEEQSEVDRQLKDLTKKKEALGKEMSAIQKMLNNKSTDINISDHALLRWLERAYNLHTDFIKEQILTDELKNEIIKNKGNCRVELSTGEIAVVQGFNIITILPKK